MRVDILDRRKGRQPISPGHHFVEQHRVKSAFLHQGNGIVAIGHRGDVVAPALEKNLMGAQQIDLVVCPQNLFGFLRLVHEYLSMWFWVMERGRRENRQMNGAGDFSIRRCGQARGP